MNAPIFGKETIEVQGKPTKQIYSFQTKADYQYWELSEIRFFKKGADKSHLRQRAKEKEVKEFLKKGGNIVQKIPVDSIKIKNEYVHIQTPIPKKEKTFGIVVAFEGKEARDKFLAINKEFYGKHINTIDSPIDRRIVCANVNGLALLKRNDISDKQFNKVVSLASHHYKELDPVQHHFAYLSQKNLGNVKILRFDNKLKRDLFVEKGKKQGYDTIVRKISNFHPVTLLQKKDNKIVDGNLKGHLKVLKNYNEKFGKKLSGPQKQKSGQTQKQPKTLKKGGMKL